jgi:hypothetical protein
MLRLNQVVKWTGAILIVFMAGAFAQGVRIKGLVIDSATSAPIAGAKIVVIEIPSLNAVTDQNGVFEITGAAVAVARPRIERSNSGFAPWNGRSLKIRNLTPGSTLDLQVFGMQGALLSHEKQVTSESGETKFRNLTRTPGVTALRIQTEPQGQTRWKASPGIHPNPPMAQSRLEKRTASDWTLSISAKGYAAKSIQMASLQTQVGTASMRPFSESGVWKKMSLPGSGNLAQSLLNDPVRPSDFYAFVSTGTGGTLSVLKSTNYGESWTVLNDTSMTGLPWGNAIDPNPLRDPSTAPTLYSCSGYGRQGLWKSTDGGVTWSQLLKMPTIFDSYGIGNTPDVYSVLVLPDNPPNHLLITFHGYWVGFPDGGLGESTDGGKTWVGHKPPTNFGQSNYAMAIDKDIWIVVGQWQSNTQGTWRTTTAGRLNGAISTAAWTQVSHCEHGHGCWQGYVDPTTKAVYNTGTAGTSYGVFRSLDSGATWENVYAGDASHLVATEQYLYSDYLLGPNLKRAPRANPTAWSSYGAAPSGMTGELGPGTSTHAAATDGSNWYVLAAMNGGGIWRFVEP